MPHSIQDFKSHPHWGGARPNLFEVVLTNEFPGSTGYDAEDFSILCKAANLPASNIASIDVPFRGRIFKVAGDRTFDTWTVTVINDIDFRIRTAMEAWMQLSDNTGNGSGFTNPADYQVDAVVKQFTEVQRLLMLKDKAWKLLNSISSTASSQLTSLLLICLMTLQIRLKNSLLNSKFNSFESIYG